MYIFSVSAKTRRDIDSFRQGQQVPFIVYIDFKDLYGAEKLCQMFVMKEGFYEVTIEKRKMIPNEKLNETLITGDSALKDALDTGYSIQMFNAH